ncbi:hypothetical protein NMYAN_60086 [Nitrosomonas nitrosa]|uniref:Uncharacterized protein n=1 Tax=Nitrosomonas nitrosa TaxID=52442 RepID=A0A8H8Z1K1_9PROT|nr:hypothetical protein NMYAN_60086 [Nitrosomonas nitrosa]
MLVAIAVCITFFEKIKRQIAQLLASIRFFDSARYPYNGLIYRNLIGKICCFHYVQSVIEA